MRNPVTLGSFAFTLGDQEVDARSIADFVSIWNRCSDSPFDTMGVRTFRKMSQPVLHYISECIKQSLETASIGPDAVDHVVFATSDSQLSRLSADFVRSSLERSGLTRAVPVMLGMQQCCSSIAALDYGHRLVADGSSVTTLLVTFDFTLNDEDRLHSFALFGDAVGSCIISSAIPGLFTLQSTAVCLDFNGLSGDDSFASRQRTATQVLGEVLAGCEVKAVFPTNLYKPMVLFNAASVGIHRSKLHFADPLQAYGHCGNCDWIINLVDFTSTNSIGRGSNYLIQSSAPGFNAAGLLQGT